jgi:hypothetical protein
MVSVEAGEREPDEGGDEGVREDHLRAGRRQQAGEDQARGMSVTVTVTVTANSQYKSNKIRQIIHINISSRASMNDFKAPGEASKLLERPSSSPKYFFLFSGFGILIWIEETLSGLGFRT